MRYIKDLKSGNSLSTLGLGCMRFPKTGSGIDMEKTEEMILSAVEQGVNYFDTAYIYPGSEQALGTVLEKHSLRDKIYIATKLPIVYCKKTEDFDRFFEKQKERLKTDHFDYYLMHMIQDMATWIKLCVLGIEDWIKKKKETGEIRQIGFSFHGSQNEFLDVLEAYDWEFCQIQYNYSNENYQAGVVGLKRAHEKGIPVVIMEPLLGGKLVDGLPKAAVQAFAEVNPEMKAAQWGLRWLWNQPEVAVILSGMSSMEQLQENIDTAKSSSIVMLTAEENQAFEKVIKILSESYKVPCTSCGYCMPCPSGVNIPACFTAYNSYFGINKKTGRNQYFQSTGLTSAKKSGARKCTKCGKCEKHCPQSIQIMKELEEVGRVMEPAWYRFGDWVVSRILGNNKSS